MSDEKYQEALEKVKHLKKTYNKGKDHWYTDKGKLIINGDSYSETKKIVVNTIKKYRDNYLDSLIIHVGIVFHDKLKDLMDKNRGGIEVQVVVYRVEEVMGKISLQLRNENYSLVNMFYGYKDIDKFNVLQLKKLAKGTLMEKYKTNLLKNYHYKDLKNDLK